MVCPTINNIYMINKINWNGLRYIGFYFSQSALQLINIYMINKINWNGLGYNDFISHGLPYD